MASFMDLPPEMRNCIYNQIITSPTSRLALSSASKEIHEEVSSYFYQHNVFTIDLPGETNGTTILPRVPDRYLKHLRHLTVNICVTAFNSTHSAERLATLAGQDMALSVLTLNLSSITSRLLSTRTDDPVLDESHTLTRALQQLLLSSVVSRLRVNLDAVWFAPGLATKLLGAFEGELEIVTVEKGVERNLLGQTMQSHLLDLGLEGEFDEGASSSSSTVDTAPSTPESLRSALSELDRFSPMHFLDEDENDVYEVGLQEKETIGVVLEDVDRSEMEEELTEEDDINDEEMEDIDGLDAIFTNLQDVAHWRANEADVYYATNFAPEMLGRWITNLADTVSEW
ncbi:hypothetical protein G6514_009113 [Epicoccum nigrum]|nr:hypothetical protein G6514_009113 [Epicoccum nigrum]